MPNIVQKPPHLNLKVKDDIEIEDEIIEESVGDDVNEVVSDVDLLNENNNAAAVAAAKYLVSLTEVTKAAQPSQESDDDEDYSDDF